MLGGRTLRTTGDIYIYAQSNKFNLLSKKALKMPWEMKYVHDLSIV